MLTSSSQNIWIQSKLPVFQQLLWYTQDNAMGHEISWNVRPASKFSSNLGSPTVSQPLPFLRLCNSRRICGERFSVFTFWRNVRYLVFLIIFSELTWSAFAVSVCYARPGQAKATGRTWFKRGRRNKKNNVKKAGHPPRVTADWLASGLQNVHCPCKFTCGANGEGAHSRKNHH